MSLRPKLRDIAARNRREIIKARLTRRDMVKLGLLTAAGSLVLKGGLSARADGGNPVSPPTRKFVEPLTLPTVAKTVSQFVLDQTASTNQGTQQVPYQDIARFPGQFNPQKFYMAHQAATQHSFSPDLPLNTVWGFDTAGSGVESPGPIYIEKYGTPIVVRNFNDLPPPNPNNPDEFGINQVSTHLHNFHSPSESDGDPVDFFKAGLHRDYHYPNVYAGFSTPQFAPNGDPSEALGFLWYHDHRFSFTSQNVYKGLVGTYLLFDDLDTGDEGGPLFLPRIGANGPDDSDTVNLADGFDIPLVFTDKVFDPQTGQQFFDLFNTDGILGDKFLVNGKIQPFFEVAPRRYRFRVLDIGPSRFYQFFLHHVQQNRDLSFLQVSSDGNLLPYALNVQSVRLGVAERADLIVDFTGLKQGDTILMQNRLEQTDGRGPSGKILNPGTNILQFRVTLPPVADDSQVLIPFGGTQKPTALRPLPDISKVPLVQRRNFEFNRSDGAWQINGQFFNPNINAIKTLPKANTAEVWTLKNGGGGWSHPIHIHLEEHRTLTRNGRPIAPNSPEIGRKDVIVLKPDDEVEVFVQFRDWLSYYPMHCHNVVHEDHAMMTFFKVVPVIA